VVEKARAFDATVLMDCLAANMVRIRGWQVKGE
jgi:hypothetical protein